MLRPARPISAESSSNGEGGSGTVAAAPVSEVDTLDRPLTAARLPPVANVTPPLATLSIADVVKIPEKLLSTFVVGGPTLDTDPVGALAVPVPETGLEVEPGEPEVDTLDPPLTAARLPPVLDIDPVGATFAEMSLSASTLSAVLRSARAGSPLAPSASPMAAAASTELRNIVISSTNCFRQHGR
jgi:hypothetical protein